MMIMPSARLNTFYLKRISPMQLLLNFKRIFIKRRPCKHHRHFSILASSWLKSVNNALQYTQLQRLAVDESLSPTENQRPRLVKNALFTKNDPTPLQSPKLLSTSSALAECIDLSLDTTIDKESSDTITQIFAGHTELIPNMIPYSHCYAGHQFGKFVGQLGDGRAICLGEYLNHKNQRWEMQLKGAGLTPYSRFADGRAVLRSSIREYLISEAMHHLGIPTTRAGMLITSEVDTVIRDEFYNGNVIREPATIVLRLSPSFIRFGSFEICSNKGGPSHSQEENHARNLLQPLLDYVMEYHYHDIWNQRDNLSEMEMYELWWQQLVDRTVQLVVQWQCFGFVHGVLNTDNMSILGLTIDYGPFGFMEYFNDDFVSNHSDQSARYSYAKQVEICQWNLDQLAQTLDDANIIPYATTKTWITNDRYYALYAMYYKQRMVSKFGLFVDESDVDHIMELFFDRLRQTACDFTNAFRALNMLSIDGINSNGNTEMEDDKLLEYLVSQCATPLQYGIIQSPNKSTRIIALQRNLPNFKKMSEILKKNSEIEHIGGLKLKDIEEILEYFDRVEVKQESDSVSNTVVSKMRIVEKQGHDRKLWKQFVGDYRKTVNKQWMKKNDEDEKESLMQRNEERIEKMNANNPKYILRNYMLQNCINKADFGEHDEINALLKLIQNPFDEQFAVDYERPAPDWAVSDSVSCSS
eukprot:632074_1